MSAPETAVDAGAGQVQQDGIFCHSPSYLDADIPPTFLCMSQVVVVCEGSHTCVNTNLYVSQGRVDRLAAMSSEKLAAAKGRGLSSANLKFQCLAASCEGTRCLPNPRMGHSKHTASDQLRTSCPNCHQCFWVRQEVHCVLRFYPKGQDILSSESLKRLDFRPMMLLGVFPYLCASPGLAERERCNPSLNPKP